MVKNIHSVMLSLLLLLAITFTTPFLSNAQAAERNSSSDETYTDEQYGFRFTHPSDWQADLAFVNGEVDDPMVITRQITVSPESDSPSQIHVNVWENNEDLSLQAWFEQYERPLHPDDATVQTAPDIQIAGLSGILIYEPAQDEAHGRMTALVAHDTLIVAVDYYTNDGGIYQQEFLDIVGSLHFAGREDDATRLPSAPLIDPSAATIQVQSCCGWTDPNLNTYPCYGGNCTWWAKYKRPDIGNYWGNAWMWRDRARREGFKVGYTPQVGAVMVAQPNVSGVSSSYGHVAYVEAVTDKRTFTISDMGYGRGCHVGNKGVRTYTQKATGDERITFIYKKTSSKPDSDLQFYIDGPSGDKTVQGNVHIWGWAADKQASGSTGVDRVHIYLDGPAGASGATVLGSATYGLERPDVASVVGEQFRRSGYRFTWNTSHVKPGKHTLYVYAFSTVSRQWTYKTRTIVVADPTNQRNLATLDFNLFLPLVQQR